MTAFDLADASTLAERVGSLGLGPLVEAAGSTPTYLVGGAVRDLLLGRERSDVDVAVEGDATELAGLLGDAVRAHERFRTASVRLDGLVVDLATTRAETYARPGALPDVSPASLSEDLARRDFTINAMAIPLQSEPELIDPHGGAGDLAAGLLRVLHPGSFSDDPTRALRAARYAARFGFSPDPETERLLRAADLGTVSKDRIEAELLKLAAEPGPRRGFDLLDEWGLLGLDGRGELVERVATLVGGGGPWSEVAERPAAVFTAATGRLPRRPGRPADPLGAARELATAAPARPSEAVELAAGHGGIELALARALGAEWLDRYVGEWRDQALEIRGEDLLEAGVPEGPAIGRGLGEALRRKLDGEISGREEELRVALEAARAGGD
jgi:tRNA nucleotidyltransferase (CCA-adding enzyme)